MRRIARRYCRPGARVEKIVADLGGVESARIGDLVERRGVADRGYPVKPGLALLAQALERRHDLAEHDFRGQVAVAAVPGDVVVQLKEIHPLELQPLEARLQRLSDRHRNAVALAGRNANLGADADVGFEALHDAPEIALGFTISIHRCGVEISDPELDRARYRALLIGGAAP